MTQERQGEPGAAEKNPLGRELVLPLWGWWDHAGLEGHLSSCISKALFPPGSLALSQVALELELVKAEPLYKVTHPLSRHLGPWACFLPAPGLL